MATQNNMGMLESLSQLNCTRAQQALLNNNNLNRGWPVAGAKAIITQLQRCMLMQGAPRDGALSLSVWRQTACYACSIAGT